MKPGPNETIFTKLIKELLKTLKQNTITLGNVEFWIDKDGPWKNLLAYSIPTAYWDKDSITKDLTKLVQDLKIEKI
jgi:hypothetical protein